MVLVMENLNIGIITTQIHFAIDTELSKHIWQLQGKGINFKVKWGVAAFASTYRWGSDKSIKELRSNYTVFCSNGIISEMCVRYLTYCKADECVNMKLIVAYLC